MNETTNLKSIERRVYLSYHQDGLIDLIMGGVLLSLSLIIWLLPEFWFVLIGGFIVMTTAYAAAKKAITFPRVGYVEFSQVRRKKTQYIFLAFIVITVFGNILTIIAWMFPALGILIFESAFTLLIIGVIGGGILAFIGYISEIWRFYLYGIIFLSSAVFTFFVPSLAVFPLIVLGSVMIIFGSILLYRFIQRYPKEILGEVERV